jgi:hypothetical protein
LKRLDYRSDCFTLALAQTGCEPHVFREGFIFGQPGIRGRIAGVAGQKLEMGSSLFLTDTV